MLTCGHWTVNYFVERLNGQLMKILRQYTVSNNFRRANLAKIHYDPVINLKCADSQRFIRVQMYICTFDVQANLQRDKTSQRGISVALFSRSIPEF